MVGSRVQHPDADVEEQAVEVVKTHEDGTRTKPGRFVPKAPVARRTPGVDSTDENDEGAIFDNPKRGCPAYPRRAAWTRASEKRRQRSRGSADPQLALWVSPWWWSSKARCASREREAVKVTEGGRKPMRGDTPRASSPRWMPFVPGRWQQSHRPSRQRGGRSSKREGRLAESFVSPRWCGRRSGGSDVDTRSPVDPTNPTSGIGAAV